MCVCKKSYGSGSIPRYRPRARFEPSQTIAAYTYQVLCFFIFIFYKYRDRLVKLLHNYAYSFIAIGTPDKTHSCCLAQYSIIKLKS